MVEHVQVGRRRVTSIAWAAAGLTLVASAAAVLVVAVGSGVLVGLDDGFVGSDWSGAMLAIAAFGGLLAAPVAVVGAGCVGLAVKVQCDRRVPEHAPLDAVALGAAAQRGVLVGCGIVIGVTSVLALVAFFPVLIFMWPIELVVLVLLLWWVPAVARSSTRGAMSPVGAPTLPV